MQLGLQLQVGHDVSAVRDGVDAVEGDVSAVKGDMSAVRDDVSAVKEAIHLYQASFFPSSGTECASRQASRCDDPVGFDEGSTLPVYWPISAYLMRS